ncbi:MAG: 50S ribosomal protein L25/general stress protein Ctc [Candidatus Omnitrophica bacterium]|nr:50S ribosomal protein L25/general stress protein Ctc [Candidatus Omnitrophota bacterium]
MEQRTLSVQRRDKTGKESCKKLRAEGLVPAVVYAGGKEAVLLAVPAREMQRILHGEGSTNAIINLMIKENGASQEKTVIIKEVQFNPVKDDMVHIDFQEISLTEKLTVNVPVVEKGEPIGVRRDGGILEHSTRELEIECLPTQIPESIVVDVSNLEIGDSIHLKDIVLPEGVEVLDSLETTLFSVMAPRLEEEPVAAAAEEAGPQEPEVIREKKAEPEGEEAEA